MKRIIIIVVILLLVVGAYFMFISADENNTRTVGDIENISQNKDGLEEPQSEKSSDQKQQEAQEYEVKKFDELSVEDLKQIQDDKKQEFDLSPSKEDLIRMKEKRIKPY